jgi:hypothetical protein
MTKFTAQQPTYYWYFDKSRSKVQLEDGTC